MSWTPDKLSTKTPLSFKLPAPESLPIVVVDDEQSVLVLLSKALTREGYPVETFESGDQALTRIAEGGVALLITDLRMPVMSGIELARRALEEDPELAILVLTGAADTDTAVESLRLGVQDYLTKPISVELLSESVGRALRRRSQDLYRHELEAWLRAEVDKRTELVRRQAQELEQVSLATLTALVRTMEAKDPHLKGHSKRIAELSGRIAEELGLGPQDVREVHNAGLLHDIGMIAIRESIVQKQGQLSDEEYQHVKDHVEIGANILEPLTHLGRTAQYVRCHHERLNGTGYPRGLKGDEIPVGGQIVALAEVFVSLTESRSYRSASSGSEALETLREGQGVWYEARVYRALKQLLTKSKSAARQD